MTSALSELTWSSVLVEAAEARVGTVIQPGLQSRESLQMGQISHRRTAFPHPLHQAFNSQEHEKENQGKKK